MLILSASNEEQRKLWISMIEELLAGEPMLLPQYLELFADNDDFVECAYEKFQNGSIVYPFIRRNIPGNIGYFDLTSPYGYGGPRVIGKISESNIISFWSAFDLFMRKENVVSEFIRFMLAREKESGYLGEIVARCSNVICNLQLDLEQIWIGFEHKVRKNVKKAQNFGLEVITDTGDRLDDFLKIYYSTMDRCNANDQYYYRKEFFIELNRSAEGHVIYFYVLKNEKVIATELVLYGKENMYSLLGGTESEYFDMRPNDLMKYKIIEWGQNCHIKNFILGGGYGLDDGIFRYKKSLAPDGVVVFYTGQRIFMQEKYEELVRNHFVDLIDEAGQFKKIQNIKYFPLYRVLN